MLVSFGLHASQTRLSGMANTVKDYNTYISSPFCTSDSAADIPSKVAMVSCVWQRGGKMQYTDAAVVDTERKAYWNEVLKVVGLLSLHACTCYYVKLRRHSVITCPMHCVDSHTVQGLQQDVAKGVRPESTVCQVK